MARRLTSNQEIAGSIPASVTFFFHMLVVQSYVFFLRECSHLERVKIISGSPEVPPNKCSLAT
jgi:hypothetical protein